MISTRALMMSDSPTQKEKKKRIVIWELCCSLPSLPSLGQQQQQQQIRVFFLTQGARPEGSSSVTVGRSADMQSSTPLSWRAGVGSVTPAGRVIREGSVLPGACLPLVSPSSPLFILSPRTNSNRLKTAKTSGYVRAEPGAAALAAFFCCRSFLASSFIGFLYWFLALPELSR